jgi:uncharacterized membrane protein YfcA
MVVAVMLAAAAVGFISGILAGMLGIGGAVVSTPAVRVLGASPLEAVGSTVPAVLPGALVGVWRYRKADLIDWRIGWVSGLSGSVFAVAGALVASALPEPRWLMILTALLMVISGWVVARGNQPGGPTGEPAAPPPDPGSPDPTVPHPDTTPVTGDPTTTAVPALHPAPPLTLLIGVGTTAGFIAGLLGLGGGIMLLPAFTALLGLPVRRAVATSLLAVAVLSIPSLITHALRGNIDWVLAVPLMVGVMPGARIGSRFTVAASDGTVRVVFGVVIGILAVIYGVTEAIGLRG